MAFCGTLQYMMAVRDRFEEDRAKYLEFFQIFKDFLKPLDGDEIIRRSKELFNGDELMVMGFYKLLLDHKRKTKKPDDFGEVFDRIHQIKMQESQSYPSGNRNPSSCCSDQQRHVKMEMTETVNKMDHKNNVEYLEYNFDKSDGMRLSGERECDLSSSSPNRDILMELPQNVGRMEIFVEAKHVDGFGKENIKEMKISQVLKRDRHKRDEESDEGLPSFRSNVQFRKRIFSSSEENGMTTEQVSQPKPTDVESWNPSYHAISEELKNLDICSQRTELDASVLNDSWKSVSGVGEFPQKRTNQDEDVLNQVEDDMFELDMLFHSAEAIVSKVEEIINEIPNDPHFEFQMEHFTSSNLRCIRQFYESKAQAVLEAIRKNAANELPQMLTDLRLWKDNLEERRREFHLICKDVYAEKHLPGS